MAFLACSSVRVICFINYTSATDFIVPPSLAHNLIMLVPEFFHTEKHPEVMSDDVGSDADV